VRDRAIVRSSSNFPSGAGIASSAAGFAALTVAACAAAGLGLDRRALSRLARTASGSAARSIFGGFVEWHAGNDLESYAESIAGQDHWNLVDLIAIVDSGEKAVGSSQGHRLADSSPFQAARVAGADDRLARCKRAILNRDFDSLAGVSELDSDMMHAVMMTSDPPLLYWLPGTIAIMRLARRLRSNGTRVFYTIDAGPNVHCICTADDAASVAAAIRRVPEVQQVLRATAGGPADRLGGR
jgi:diphosphomevalonate decarboxylase